jgi:hypothetical protein
MTSYVTVYIVGGAGGGWSIQFAMAGLLDFIDNKEGYSLVMTRRVWVNYFGDSKVALYRCIVDCDEYTGDMLIADASELACEGVEFVKGQELEGKLYLVAYGGPMNVPFLAVVMEGRNAIELDSDDEEMQYSSDDSDDNELHSPDCPCMHEIDDEAMDKKFCC